MDEFEFSKAFDYAWEMVQGLNKRIDKEKPWSLAKEGKTEQLEECMNGLVEELVVITRMLMPFLPETATRIEKVFVCDEILPPKIPLFPK